MPTQIIHIIAVRKREKMGKLLFRHSLNGLWKFHYARNYASAIPGFEEEAYSCKDWEDIYVPAHIRWKDMMHRSMPMSVSVGGAMKNFIGTDPGTF